MWLIIGFAILKVYVDSEVLHPFYDMLKCQELLKDFKLNYEKTLQTLVS